MRKLSLLVPIIMSAALLMMSCAASQSKQNKEQVTLTIMGKENDLKKSYMTDIFDKYEKETGNKIELIAFKDEEFEANAVKCFESGNAPDILQHFHNTELDKYNVEKNFFYMNDEEWAEDLTEGADAYCRDKEGNLLGLPFWENSISGCYYNKTILDSLGLKPAETQEEFDMLCQALAATRYAPICWPAKGCSWMIQFALDPIFADNPELLEKLNKNEITYADIPEVTDMLEWISSAADKGWFGNDYLNEGWDEINTSMNSGKAVMTFMWDTWFYTDLSKDGKYGIDDFALMPVFLNTEENGTYEGGNLNMLMANRNSPHLGDVLNFFKFCADEENYNEAFDGISTVNCFKGQTTNIQSKMVTDATESVNKYERVSTAVSRIIGYSGDDVVSAIDSLLRKKTDVQGCIKLLDDYRIAEAHKIGAEGF